MVKKLFKYEFTSYLKTLIPFNIVLLSVAAFTRIIQFFDLDIPGYDVVYDIVFSLSTMTYFLAIVACFAAVFVMAVIRFYKNLYTAEGYLSFTLPVTPAQHIFVKLATAVALMLLTVVSTIVSFAIFSAGELGIEVVKAGGYLFKKLYEVTGISLWFYIPELILVFTASLATSLLFYYTCISLGQLFKKNRILGAFGVYFIFYIATQILNTIVMVIWTILAGSGVFDKMWEFIGDNIIAVLHFVFVGSAVLFAAVSVGHFFINRLIMLKKLNLE